MRRRLFSVFMALIVALVFNFSAFADDIKDKQDQLEETQGNIDKTKDTIDDLKDRILDNESQAKKLDGSISAVDSDILKMKQKINSVQNDLDKATEELNAAIDDYNKQDASMKKRINALYKNSTSEGYLEVLLESQSFSDFVTRVDILKKIIDYDIRMLEEMKQKREEINRKKLAIEQKKAELVSLKADLDAKKKKLVAQKNEKKKLLTLLNQQKAHYIDILEQEEAEASKLQKEIKELLAKSQGNYDGSKYAILHRSDFPSSSLPRITSYFGYRVDPITHTTRYHSGLDISTRRLEDKPVYAMAPGRVIKASYSGSYGNVVIIDHGSGFATLYAHNNSLLVKAGDYVTGGEKIALSGSTGRSTGPHVHFSVLKDGEFINPLPYYFLGY
jgi:murein DD-endopeptidase MepM/ murein hydrolase activator NlpD